MRTSKPTEYIEIRGTVQAMSAKAVLFKIEGHGEEWIPKSQISTDVTEDTTLLRVADWLVEKNNWVSFATDDRFDDYPAGGDF